jgi:hypothetical protein
LLKSVKRLAMYADTIGKNWIWKGWTRLGPIIDHELALGDVISPGISEYEPLANKEMLTGFSY